MSHSRPGRWVDAELDHFHDWADRAKVGSRFCYFKTPPGMGEYERPAGRMRFARRMYERGEGFLVQARAPDGVYSYWVERCRPMALTRIEALGRIIPTPKHRARSLAEHRIEAQADMRRAVPHVTRVTRKDKK